MLQKMATALTRWSTRWVPDAWVIAVALSVFAFIIALIFTDSSVYQLIQYWGRGFWTLLGFAMQMSLIIMTGYILAVSPPVGRLLNKLAGIPKSPTGCIAMMAAFSMVSAWINWGFSIVGGAVFTKYIARKQRGVDYRLLVASAYLGMGTFWHAGLSASAPLLVATPKHFMEAKIGLIPVTQTIFHPFNLLLCATILITLTLFTPRLHPKPGNVIEADPAALGEEQGFQPPVLPENPTPGQRMEHSPIINYLTGIAGIVWLFWHFSTNGAVLTLDVVNFGFLMIGILLHRTPASLLKAAEEAGTFIWGVVLQFPFYAGIFGIISYSKLDGIIADWFTAIATKDTYALIVFWYSGILNYFVPSGGSKWAIEAPYVIEAGRNLGVPDALSVVAYSWGDMATDIIQPFWAIPLLGVAKLGFKDIMGYCLILFFTYMVITSLFFWAAPLFYF
jgi:short-chain fatty acids transporter